MIPGPSYSEEDAPLFERVANAVGTELRTLQAAHKVAAEIKGAQRRSERPESLLLRLTDDLPGLRFLLPGIYRRRAKAADRADLQRAMGMLLTVVQQRATELSRA